MSAKTGVHAVFTKNMVISGIALLMNTAMFHAYLAIMAEYSISLGVQESFAGVVTGSFVVGAMLARFFVGGAMERLGWKRITLTLLLLIAVTCLLYFVIKNPVALSCIRFVQGFFFGFTNTALMTVGMSSIPRDRYSEGTAYFMLAPPLSLAMGPFFSGLLYDAFGPNGSLAFALGVAVLSLAFALGIDFSVMDHTEQESADEPLEEEEVTGISRFLEPRAFGVSGCIGLIGLSFASIQSYYRLYAVEVDLVEIFSIFFVMYSAGILIMRPIAGKLQDRYGDNAVIYPAILFQGTGLLAIALFPCIASVIYCAVAGAMGFGVLNSAFNSIIGRSLPTSRLSYGLSTYYLVVDFSTGFGAAFWGMAIAGIGFTWSLVIGGVVAFFTLPLYYMVWGRRDHSA